jgi:hypothetical protein
MAFVDITSFLVHVAADSSAAITTLDVICSDPEVGRPGPIHCLRYAGHRSGLGMLQLCISGNSKKSIHEKAKVLYQLAEIEFASMAIIRGC